MKNKSAFTIVECLIVIAILFLILSIIVPSLLKSKKDKEEAKNKQPDVTLTKDNASLIDCRVSEVIVDSERYLIFRYNGQLAVCKK